MSRTVQVALNVRELARLHELHVAMVVATNLYNQVLATHCDRADIDPQTVENAEEKDGGITFTVRDESPAVATKPELLVS